MPKEVEMRVVVDAATGSMSVDKTLLQVDDVIDAGQVVKIDVKSKWAFITVRTQPFDKMGTSATGNRQQVHVTAGNKRVKVPRGSEINITRTMPTEEEERVKRIDAIVWEAEERAARAHKEVYNQVVYMTKRFHESDEKGYVYPFPLDAAGQVYKAQCEDAVWREVTSTVEHLTEVNGVPKDVAWLTAIVHVRKMAVDRLVNKNYRNPLSRSTSVLGNVEEDLKEQAWAVFMDDTKYMRAETLLAEMGEES